MGFKFFKAKTEKQKNAAGRKADERKRAADGKNGSETKNKRLRPEICLSLNCTDMAEIKSDIEEYGEYCRVIEWCADKAAGTENMSEEEFVSMLREIKKLCAGKKLIFDYNNAAADGACNAETDGCVRNGGSATGRIEACGSAADGHETGSRLRRWAMGRADIIDVDAADPDLSRMVREAKRRKTKILVSYHNFDRMMDRDEIAEQFVKMERSGADILKIACAAEKEEDTYSILEGAAAYTKLRGHKPIVAVAMGEAGRTSRVCAGDFGSVMSYACGSRQTAPGQFSARDLSRYLDTYYGEK